jgi:hypothetical protein
MNQGALCRPIQEFLQVQIHHDPVAGLHVLLRFQHRAVRASPWPEAVAVLAERRVDERLQYLQKRLLDQSVNGSGDGGFIKHSSQLSIAMTGLQVSRAADSIL